MAEIQSALDKGRKVVRVVKAVSAAPPPVKAPADHSVSQPKPGIPSTVPDDFLDDTPVNNAVAPPKAVVVPALKAAVVPALKAAKAKTPSTKKVAAAAATPVVPSPEPSRVSGRARKLNPKYYDVETTVTTPSLRASKTSETEEEEEEEEYREPEEEEEVVATPPQPKKTAVKRRAEDRAVEEVSSTVETPKKAKQEKKSTKRKAEPEVKATPPVATPTRQSARRTRNK